MNGNSINPTARVRTVGSPETSFSYPSDPLWSSTPFTSCISLLTSSSLMPSWPKQTSERASRRPQGLLSHCQSFSVFQSVPCLTYKSDHLTPSRKSQSTSHGFQDWVICGHVSTTLFLLCYLSISGGSQPGHYISIGFWFTVGSHPRAAKWRREDSPAWHLWVSLGMAADGYNEVWPAAFRISQKFGTDRPHRERV